MKNRLADSGRVVVSSRTCRPSILMMKKIGFCEEEISGMLEDKPILLALELTRQCNLQCCHCYVSAGPKIFDQHHISEKTWLHCVKEAKEIGITRVQFIGGEPTLHPALYMLIEQVGELGFSDIELYSNATRLEEPLFYAMLQNKVRLATSLYGATDSQHDLFTKVSGSFARTCSNIKKALSMGITVRVAVVRNDDERTIIDVASAFARGLGVQHVSIDVVRAFGRGEASGGQANGCEACGVSVLRVCNDGVISGCSMSREPTLGHIRSGLESAMQKLTSRKFASRYRTAGSGIC